MLGRSPKANAWRKERYYKKKLVRIARQRGRDIEFKLLSNIPKLRIAY